MLEFENDILLECFNENCLLVLAKGLALPDIFTAFLKIYSDSAHLALVINTTAKDEEYFITALRKEKVSVLPKLVTNDVAVADRRRFYLEGGVQFVTSRILVMDLLTDRLPVEHVSGIFVYNAHQVTDSFQEAFILTMYRQKNKKGFVKAFSDNATKFDRGFCQIHAALKALRLSQLVLWPRFHAVVQATLNERTPEVEEIAVKLTPAMRSIQTALLDIVNTCLVEIRQGNKTLDLPELSAQTLLTGGFDFAVRKYLDPTWHNLSARSKQLLGELRLLRTLIFYLEHLDAVSFLAHVNTLLATEQLAGSHSGWMYTKSAQEFFKSARSRVFKEKKSAKSDKSQKPQSELGADTSKNETSEESGDTKAETELSVEPLPKWDALLAVLRQIVRQFDAMRADDETYSDCSGRVLVCVANRTQALQVEQLISEGEPSISHSALDRHQGSLKIKYKAKQPAFQPFLLTVQILDPQQPVSAQNAEKTAESPKKVSEGQLLIEAVKEKQKLEIRRNRKRKHPDENFEQLSLTQIFDSKKSDLEAEDNEPGPSTSSKVDEADEQNRSYVKGETPEVLILTTSVKRPYALRQALYEYSPSFVVLYNADVYAVRTIEVYKAKTSDIPLRVYFLMYKNSSEEERYLRLYAQAEAMVARYSKAILLIEFEQGKPFCLQDKRQRNEISRNDISAKLALITIHFPQLRIVWSQSPQATVDIFEDLKYNHAQPSVPADASASADVDLGDARNDEQEPVSMVGKQRSPAMKMLAKLPPVTADVAARIGRRVACMADLAKLSVDELSEIVESKSCAEKLVKFLNTDVTAVFAAAFSKKK